MKKLIAFLVFVVIAVLGVLFVVDSLKNTEEGVALLFVATVLGAFFLIIVFYALFSKKSEGKEGKPLQMAHKPKNKSW